MNQLPPALILGLHYSSIPVARSLGRRGVKVYGVGDQEVGLAKHSRHLSCVTSPDAEDDLLEFLRRFAEQSADGIVAIPMSDRFVRFMAKHHATLSGLYRYPMSDPELIGRLTSKSGTAALLTELQVEHPKSFVLRQGESDLPDAADLTLPCILKPELQETWQGSEAFQRAFGGGQRALLIEDRERLVDTVKILSAIGNTVVQEFVPGPSENHFYYAGYRDRHGTILASFIGNKVRTLPNGLGSETLLRSAHNADLLSCGDDILQRLDYHGPAGIDFKYDARDDRPRVIEINCRIGINDCYLVKHGLDLPFFYYEDSLGHDVPAQREYPAGVIWHDLCRDIYWLRSYRKDLGLSWGEWLGDLRAPGMEALFDVRDPKPFMAALMGLMRSGLMKSRRQPRQTASP